MTKSADRRKMGKLERRNTLIAYSFLAPNFIGFVVFTLIPVIFSIVLAFMNWIRAILQNIKKCDWLVLKREKLTADIVNEINIKNRKNT